MLKRLIALSVFSMILALASWGTSGCGSSSTTNIEGFPLVGGGYALRELDDPECLGPIPSTLGIMGQTSGNPDQVTISIIKIWESGLMKLPGSVTKSGFVTFQGTVETGQIMSCEGQAIIEGTSKSDITIPFDCTVDSKPCHAIFDNDSTEPTLFSSCEFNASDKTTALSTIQSYDVSPMPQEAADALKVGCTYSQKLSARLFLEAFLCSIGVNPALVDNPDSSGIDPDIYLAVDSLDFIDLDNLSISCETEIADL